MKKNQRLSLWQYVLYIIAYLGLVYPNSTFAQRRDLTGTVTGGNETLPGVTILVKGADIHTLTDEKGNFRINAGASDTLLFSFIGFESQEVPVGNQTAMQVDLKPKSESLDEVVVIGYGAQKKKLNTGATLQIKDEELAARLKPNPLHALQGQSPGVTITTGGGQPGAPTKVFIRGMGTIGNTTPLFIVDGVQTQNIDYLNSYDIESIDVLKDAASAAIYGSRASNGVILITTKQGKAGNTQITLDVNYGLQSLAKKLKVLNAQEYAMLMNEKFVNSGDKPFFTGERMEKINAMGEGTDWLGLIFEENVPIKNYSLGFSGGNDRSTFSTGLSYTDQGGILGGSSQNNLTRVTFRVNSEHRFYKNLLKVGENITFTHTDLLGGGNNLVTQSIATPPILMNKDENGKYIDNTTGLLAEFGGNSYSNPYALMLLNNQQINKSIKFLGNIYFELQPVNNLKIRSSLGSVFDNSSYRSYTPIFPQLGPFANPSTRTYDGAFQSSSQSLQLVLTNTLSYERNIGENQFNIVLGSEAQRTDGVYLSGSNQNLIFNDFEHAYIRNALGKNNQGLMNVDGYPTQHRLLSYFARLSYNYKEKYLFNATIRSDGSSNFAMETRRGYFPSVSAGWVISDESFMGVTNPWLKSLKIRGSWGQNGNQNLPAFRYLATVNSNLTYSLGTTEDGLLVPGASLGSMSNPNLQWERSEQTNIGFDATFLEGRLAANFDYYNKSTKGWLVSPPISSVIGLSPPWINGGNVINKGVELSVTYRGRVGELGYSLNVNGAYNKNLVTNVPNNIIHGLGGGLWDNSQEYYRTETGYPLGYFWMLKTDGVFQNIEEVNNYMHEGKLTQPNAVPGDLRYVDQNNDGLINDNDRVNVGDPFPDFVYGFNLNLNYKGFDLLMNANGVADVQVVQAYYNHARYFPNYTKEALERWHGEGTSYRYPKLNKSNSNWTNNSDIYIYQAAFLRLSNITVGYDMYRLFKFQPLKQSRIFVSVMNAYTFTKYNGMDPEVGYGQEYSAGRDFGFVPNPRIIMAGANIKF